MHKAVLAHLPVDIAVMVAAVADWRVRTEEGEKRKKKAGLEPEPLHLVENPDILKTVGHHPDRPKLVIGFAAETQSVIENAQAKLSSKGADLIVANDVSSLSGVMGGDRNRVHLVAQNGTESWPDLSKVEVAERLADWIAKKVLQ
jgi:phosphopantothenoylcysteine decarboxylase/phosphopantothenate--cysteine ligase